ncbi:unnamed protein product [Protopolystoma xenopodis]|uniref:Uncharacterized protein n=1 Tax=Protopolystoma xenopodis TaxID=117903 RepID=A0A448XRH3_9PLAT|nr:unnamed protein product [Protopolystoma xenopodis]
MNHVLPKSKSKSRSPNRFQSGPRRKSAGPSRARRVRSPGRAGPGIAIAGFAVASTKWPGALFPMPKSIPTT